MKLLITLMTALLIGQLAMSHEDHNHTPGAVTAPHGGKLKETSELYLELVADSERFKNYAMDHDMKSVALKDLKLEGTFKLPKKTKSETLVFQTAQDHFVAKVDAKGAHRYSVDLKVTLNNKTEKLKFNVEPN